MSALLKFYNEDAKQPICRVDELTYGCELTTDTLGSLAPSKDLEGTVKNVGGSFKVSNKYITEIPTVTYRIKKRNIERDEQGNEIPDKSEANDTMGAVYLEIRKDGKSTSWKIDDYDTDLWIGLNQGPDGPLEDQMSNFKPDEYPDVGAMKLGELSILNSTDYLRAIYDFENLVVVKKLVDDLGILEFDVNNPNYDTPQWANARMKSIQALIINSIEKCGKYKARLRYLKKAKINVDKLDKYYTDAQNTGTEENDLQLKKIGKKYVEDLYKSYIDIGLLSGIEFTKNETETEPKDPISGSRDALEAKLDAIVNIDTSKKEKMNPRKVSSR